MTLGGLVLLWPATMEMARQMADWQRYERLTGDRGTRCSNGEAGVMANYAPSCRTERKLWLSSRDIYVWVHVWLLATANASAFHAEFPSFKHLPQFCSYDSANNGSL